MTAVANTLRKIRHDEDTQTHTSGAKGHTREAKLALAALAGQTPTMLPQLPSPTRPIDPPSIFVGPPSIFVGGGQPSAEAQLMKAVWVRPVAPPSTFRIDVALNFRNSQELSAHCKSNGLIPPDVFIYKETEQKIYQRVAREFKYLEGLSADDIRKKAKILLNDINDGVPRKNDFYLSPTERDKIADRICEVMLKDPRDCPDCPGLFGDDPYSSNSKPSCYAPDEEQ